MFWSILLNILGLVLGLFIFICLMMFMQYKVHKITTEKDPDKLLNDLLRSLRF